MQAKAVNAIEARSQLLAGVSANSWAFAIRVWLTCLVALYASFWLQLEVPSSAAIKVAILALPTRGQGLEKAGFRLFATAIGVAASIGISPDSSHRPTGFSRRCSAFGLASASVAPRS
ncbi:MAG: FUSC family protein [Bradyrhizobium sp.]|nr:FUSC family protein [Bradyrhizobium sp.]